MQEKGWCRQESVLVDWQRFTKFQTGKANAAGIAQVSECHGDGADKMKMSEESCDHLPGLPPARAAVSG